MVSVTPRPLFIHGKDSVPVVQKAVWAPGSVWTGAEILAPQLGFDPQTVQPMASRYAVYATRPMEILENRKKKFSPGIETSMCVEKVRKFRVGRTWEKADIWSP